MQAVIAPEGTVPAGRIVDSYQAPEGLTGLLHHNGAGHAIEHVLPTHVLVLARRREGVGNALPRGMAPRPAQLWPGPD